MWGEPRGSHDGSEGDAEPLPVAMRFDGRHVRLREESVAESGQQAPGVRAGNLDGRHVRRAGPARWDAIPSFHERDRPDGDREVLALAAPDVRAVPQQWWHVGGRVALEAIRRAPNCVRGAEDASDEDRQLLSREVPSRES